jgi:hypothetical protein
VQGIEVMSTLKLKMPDKLFQEISVPAMNMTPLKLSINGDSVSMLQNGQATPLPATAKASLFANAQVCPELYYGTATLALAPMLEAVGDAQAYVLTITQESGIKITAYYDEATGLKIKEVTAAGSSELSNYQTVNGIKIPYTKKAEMGGQLIEFKVKEAKINSGLTDADFK